MIFTNLIQGNLNTQFIGQHIEYYPFTDSTNEDIWELMEDDEAKNGSLVITDDQRKGKGRRDNQWYSSPGQNLTFSFLLTHDLNPEKLGLISLLAGIGICKGIQQFSNLNCSLKWPNDIFLDNKKLGGILIESKEINDKKYLCVGIGINVNSGISQFPYEIQKSSISLISKTEQPIQREPLLASILNNIEDEYLYQFDNVTTNWLQYCNHNNAEVTFHYGEKIISGEFVGITEYGYAKLKFVDKIETFPGGELIL